MRKFIISLILCISLCSSICGCFDDSTNENGTHAITWVVDGATSQETYNHGDVISFETPKKEGFVFVGWSESENGEIIDLSDVKVYENNTYYAIFREKSILTRDEYERQLAHYGSSWNEDFKTRTRICFAFKMQAGTIVKFNGDKNVYKWSVNETQDNANMFATDYIDPGWNVSPKSGAKGWISDTHYVTQTLCYPAIIMTRVDGVALSSDELAKMKSWFTVEGKKTTALTSNDDGAFTREEFLEQVAVYGSVPNPTNKTRGKITIVIKLRKGAIINYVGDSTYNWAVVESNDVSRSTACLDSGWLDNNTYVSLLDGACLSLTIKRADGAELTREELSSLHNLFTVTGTKLGNNDVSTVPQRDYEIKSIAHRGYSLYAPENTIPAYEYAAKMGFKYVECDILFTSDGVPVLCHDDTINRTSDGTGKIADMTYSQLLQYDFGLWMGYEYKGTKIPTLEEFLIVCKNLNLIPYIEIKDTVSDAQAKTLVSIVKKYYDSNDVNYISFSADALDKISKEDDVARLGFVVSGNITTSVITVASNLRTGKNQVFVDALYSKATAAAATLCKNANLPLEVWTVDNTSLIDSKQPYVSGISSNWILAGAYLEEKNF